MTMHGQEPVSFEDVKDEIFDMVKPADPCKITLQDLLSWYKILYTIYYDIEKYIRLLNCKIF